MKTLRIGFLLDSKHCPQSQCSIIDRIEHSPELDISLLVFNNNKHSKDTHFESKAANNSLLLKILRPFRIAFSMINPKAYGLPTLYHRFDQKNNPAINTLWDKKTVLENYQGRSLNITPINKGFSTYIKETDLRLIENENIDILIRFGFGIIRGDIHQSAKYGVWSFHHGDNRFYRGGPPGIWELIKGKRHISVTLQRLNDKLDCGNTIGRFTHRSDLFSALKNKSIIYQSCADLLLQKLIQTQSMGFESISKSAIYQEKIPESTILKSPNNLETLFLFYRIIKHYLELRWPRKKKLQWFLAIKNQDHQLAQLKSTQLIIPPKDRFFADPFIIEKNQKHYIFFEELVYSKGNAHISVAELDDGSLKNIKPIIQEDFHLSYPFIFEDNDEWYLIPESRENKDVRLYKCSKFPFEWEFQQILIPNVELLDATIYKQDETYFLFANQYEPNRDTSNECLVVYYSESLFGPWTAHPLNPLTTNICNSRPAGNLFHHQNKLILPTQNCAVRYGHGINFNEITISKNNFSMKKINQLNPDWLTNNLGSHTWNGNKKYVVTDAHRYIQR